MTLEAYRLILKNVTDYNWIPANLRILKPGKGELKGTGEESLPPSYTPTFLYNQNNKRQTFLIEHIFYQTENKLTLVYLVNLPKFNKPLLSIKPPPISTKPPPPLLNILETKKPQLIFKINYTVLLISSISLPRLQDGEYNRQNTISTHQQHDQHRDCPRYQHNIWPWACNAYVQRTRAHSYERKPDTDHIGDSNWQRYCLFSSLPPPKTAHAY